MTERRETVGFRWFLSISFLLSAGFGLLLAHLAVNAAIEQAHLVVLRKVTDQAVLRAAQDVLGEQHETIRVFIGGAVILGLASAFGLIYALGRRMILAPLAALRRSEARLRDSEGRARRLAMVAEQTTDLVIIYDADGLITWVNGAFEAATGFTLREVKGRAPSDFLNGARSDSAVSDRIAAAMQAGEPVSAQIVNYSKTGREYLVELSVSPVFDEEGRVANFIAVERDITDRDRAQRRLQEALEAIESPISVFDDREVLVAFNEAYRKFGHRYGVRAVEGASLPDLVRQAVSGGMYFDNGESLDDAIARRLAEWRTIQSAEKLIEHGDGLAILLREVRTHSGDTVSVRTDVTELIEARRRAEAATAAKSRFLAAISHEVRTPMNGVISMAELLLESEMTQEQRAGLELISQSGQALVTIINDILDFSKLEAGKMPIRPEPFDLVEAVEEVSALLTPTGARKGLACSFDFDPHAPRHFIGDMGRIRQIVTNLFGNAIKFTETGSIAVKVGAIPHGEVATITVDVIDTGIGISPEALEQVFAPFEQADNAGAIRMQEGTGLGLSISRQLAMNMGGQITARSVRGEGSHFTLTLDLPVIRRVRTPGPLTGKRVHLCGSEARQAPRASQVVALGGVVLDDAAAAAEPTPPDLVIAALDDNARAPDVALAYGPIPLILIVPPNGSGDGCLADAPHARLLRRPVRQALLARTIGKLLDTASPPAVSTARVAGPSRPEGSAAGCPHVAIIEDNQTTATIMRAILSPLFGRIDVFPTAGAGLDAIQQRCPDLIIMDLNLPDMSGLEAMRLIRAAEADSKGIRTPIMAATANAGDADRAACFAAGADDFILKPVDPKQLRSAARRWTEGEAEASDAASPRGRNARAVG